MKAILIPTDFSDCAYYAAKVAVSIAKKSKATIHLLHVIDIPYITEDIGLNNFQNFQEITFLSEHAKKEMDQWINDPIFKGLEVRHWVEYDSTHSRIIRHIDKHQIDLVVMGSHGTSGLQGLIIGSNAERVARFADCPVLIIKNDDDTFELKNIVLASDFNEKSNLFFEQFITFAHLFDAHIHLLTITTSEDFETTQQNNELMQNFADNFKLKNYSIHIYNDKDDEDGILHYSKDVKADLIAIGTHGRTGLAHLIIGSLAEDVINHSSIPVISIKIKQPKKSPKLSPKNKHLKSLKEKI